jgi:hypothetical protein
MGRDSGEAGRAQQRRALATAGLLLVASLVFIGLYAWFSFGDMAMTAGGYVALALGSIGTIALAVGLMSLVFFSNRYGYDERAGRGDAPEDRD